MGDEIPVSRSPWSGGRKGQSAHPADLFGAGLGLEANIVRGHVSKDHVHVLLSCDPKLLPSEIMKRVKGRSSRKLQQEFPHLGKKYWGRHFWARGYFCATVGDVTEEQIREYIRRHDEEPPDENFNVED